jgi:hypothetical protein
VPPHKYILLSFGMLTTDCDTSAYAGPIPGIAGAIPTKTPEPTLLLSTPSTTYTVQYHPVGRSRISRTRELHGRSSYLRRVNKDEVIPHTRRRLDNTSLELRVIGSRSLLAARGARLEMPMSLLPPCSKHVHFAETHTAPHHLRQSTRSS